MNDDYDEEVELETGVAECSAEDWMDAPLTVSGVAIGEDEETRTPDGNVKLWTKDALKDATDSLEGVQLTKNHEHDRVEGVIGEVTKANYKDGLGVLFEAHVHDESVAEKIRQDLLEVSIHALHTLDGMDDEGRFVVDKAHFVDLSVVPRGEAESNTVAPGPLASAALSRAELSAVVDESFGTGKTGGIEDSDDAHEGADGSATESGDTAGGAVLADSTESDANHDDGEDVDSNGESTQSSLAETDADLSEQEIDMTEETQEVEDEELDESPDVEDEVSEEELSEADEADETDSEEAELSREELEAHVNELEDELEALRGENEALLNEVESVRIEYAEALSAGSAFSAEELADKFSADELAAKYEETDVELAQSESRPAPQTGGINESEESELEATDDGTEERIAELESKIEQLDDAGFDAAASERRAELAELRDE